MTDPHTGNGQFSMLWRRKQLRDDSPPSEATGIRPRTAETAPANDTATSLGFELVVLDGVDAGARVHMGVGASRIIVGTGPGCHLRLTDPFVSRRHATLHFVNENQIRISDLSSTNGTFVAEIRIAEALLQLGDLIRLGETFLRFAVARDPRSTSVAGAGFANRYLERVRTMPIKIG